MMLQMFNIGDIIKRKYVSIDLERYFFILDILETNINNEPGFTKYLVLELGEGESPIPYTIHPTTNVEWPVEKVA